VLSGFYSIFKLASYNDVEFEKFYAFAYAGIGYSFPFWLISQLCFMKLLQHNFRWTFAGGFLSFKPYIPKSLMLSGEHNVGSHFTLVNYQVCTYPPELVFFYILSKLFACCNVLHIFFFRLNRLGLHLQLLPF